MSRPLITFAAEEDYAASLRWYAERSLQAAQGFEAEFDRALDAIGSDPRRFPLCDSRHRFYLMDRYPFQVIYRQHGEEWMVIAVAHTKRQPGYWSDR
jgi:plasmid stabilization system protein ParE